VSSYTSNSSNELTATSSASYTYDYDGNTTSKTNSTGTTNYGWDYENRLTSVTLPSSGGSVSFKYDPLGRRIQKVYTTGSTTTTTNYLYDGESDIEEVNASGSIVARYTQGRNVDEPLAESRSSATSFYEGDGLGSITSLTNSSGSIANAYTYDSFGTATASSGSIINSIRYTGREFDGETGLYYYRSRYLDPSVGRFLSEDNAGFAAGTDFYQYVANNPTQWTDPFGLCPPNNKKCGVKSLGYDKTGAIPKDTVIHIMPSF
jgi:RHS repeat-associated protein